ncbi:MULTISPECIES: hypothetical protein [unclassified Fusibacter]|uniref:hypothetical protein n=1 Tax=unclassified Fusibacter TaxID=2624464 RepID=UPI0010132BA8|nr:MULTISPECIES: hypothetical protein [unclassified Fusibacter]MCK8059390.1 hypothetical protein [Fusibacter sp. A2]NPE21146.1 hypothetical protein [Fusibacter sp. A1]RXV62415.1 hypothetical protein DWB64_04870 [Fusibacter sp. A1]
MKKLLSLTLALLLVLSFASGCAKKESARDLLTQTFEQSANLTSSRALMDLTMNVDASEDFLAQDPAVPTYIDMINAGKLTLDIASDSIKGNMNGTVSVESNGMAFKFDLYMKDFESMIIKTPFLDEYLTLDTSASMELSKDTEKLKSLNTDMTSIFLNAVKDENLTVEYGVDFEGMDGSTKLDYVTMSFDQDSFLALIKELIPAIYGNESIQETMKKSIIAQNETYGIELSDEEIEAQIAMLTEGFPQMLDELDDTISFDSLVVKMGIDSDYNTRVMDMTMGMTVKELDSQVSMTMNMNTEAYAFNQPVEPHTIVITEENSISFEDFIMQMMFGGMGM